MENKNKEPKVKISWFQRWVVNNRLVSVLAVVVLFLTAVYLLHLTKFIFKPLNALFAAVGAPVITAGIFYYLLEPIVRWLHKKTKLSNGLIILLIFLIALLLLILISIFVGPMIRDNLINFFQHWPEYYRALTRQLNKIFSYPALIPVRNWVLSTNNDLNQQVIEWSRSYLSNGIQGVSRFTHAVLMFFITLITFPFILYYMLKEGYKFPDYVSQFFPQRLRLSLKNLLDDINKQISDYLRGQILTSIAVSIMFMIGFSIIGLPYGIWIGLIAGPLNLIPYLGSFLAMVPAIIVGIIYGYHLVLASLVVFLIEQTLESRLIHPKIMGASMHIHPVTVLIILLAAGEMFGLLGVAFGIPAYAVIKVIIGRIYKWWREESNLF
ncbi:AI-2E family transporter [Oenococcus alcoholitolerans]|uniref:AI-2E family transporter n=1 Tax=Oenococcus alcoholitolerans TaxID=931074 RepID=UPI003F71329B